MTLFGIDRLLAEPELHRPLEGKRVALLAHPAIVQLMTQRARFSRSQARLATRSITILEQAGLPTRQAVEAHVALVAFTLGWIVQEVSRPAAPSTALLRDDPVLRRAMSVLAESATDERFEAGLRLILDGALCARP